MLAAIWAARRFDRPACVRACGVPHNQQLAPSQWSKYAVTPGDVAWMEARMAEAALASPAPPPRPMEAPPAVRREVTLAPGPEVGPLSPRRASATVGKAAAPRPNPRAPDHGRHPGDVAGDGWLARMVLERRAAGLPWSQIAKQTGRNEIDLRRVYDPEFEREAAPRAAGPAGRDCHPVRLGTVEAKVVVAVWQGTRGVADLCGQLGKTPDAIRSLLQTLKEKGCVTRAAGFVTLTAAGARQAKALADG